MNCGNAVGGLPLITRGQEPVPAGGFLWEPQQPAPRAALTAPRDLLPPVISPGDDGQRRHKKTRQGRPRGYSEVKESIRPVTQAYSAIYGNTRVVSGLGSPGQMWSTRTGFPGQKELP